MQNLRSFFVFMIIWMVAAYLAGLNAPAPVGAGFWVGVWHGLVLPGSLALSLVGNLQVYAVQNAGLEYILGFALGIFGTGTFAAFVYVVCEKIFIKMQRMGVL